MAEARAILLLVLLVAACGGGPAASGGPITPASSGPTAATPTVFPGTATEGPGGRDTDACALLTADDIKAVTGLDLAAPGAAGPAFGIFSESCGWELVADAAVAPSIALGVRGSGGEAQFDPYVEAFYEIYGHKPIEGLGDEAADVGSGSVVVRVGETIFQLQYLAFEDTDVELATELARKVISNLGR